MELASVKDEFCHKVQEKPIIIVPESLHSGQDDENLKSTTFHQGSEVNMSKTSSTVDTVDDIKRWTDKVEEKPKIIVPESSHAENYVLLSNIKGEESFKSTNFQTNNYNGEMNTVDNIRRWTVSSSVILPIDKTEDGFNIETADISTGRVLLADSVKNEDTDTFGAPICQLHEHTDQLAAIPSLILDPPEQSTDSEVLLIPWSSNRQFDNSSTWDSQVKTFSEPTSITDGKFTLKVGHALCRDAKAIHETPQQLKGNSFGTKRFVGTVTESSSRQNPRKEMSEKSYKCDICNKTCQSSSKLTIHQRIHTGEKPYKCDDCGKEFSYRNSLKSHQRLHTGEKPYKCHVCRKGFVTSGNLAQHHRVHTGEKPYKCDVCNRAFTQSNDLKKHQRIHTGEKPYKCNVCHKEFSDTSNLSDHKRIHTEKSYNCDVCGKRFSRSGSLVQHITSTERNNRSPMCTCMVRRGASVRFSSESMGVNDCLGREALTSPADKKSYR